MEQELIDQYIKQLTPIEIKAFHIAHEHLGSSFSIVKSNGFIQWKKEQNYQSSHTTHTNSNS